MLGPNGSGKTTIMKMLLNLSKPTAGEIEIFSENITERSHRMLSRIGSMIEFPVFYDQLTARENLHLHCEYMGFYHKSAIDDALKLVHLHKNQHQKVKQFSLGMKQRLGIARAISTRPEFLILDEPINGLDVYGLHDMRNLFKELVSKYEVSILISSHFLGEIEQMADTIAVINNGFLLEETSMSQIIQDNGEYIELQVDNNEKAVYILDNHLGLHHYKVIGEDKVRIYDSAVPLKEISKELALNNVGIDSMHTKNGSLEDYFLNLLTNKGLNVQGNEIISVEK